MRNILYYISCLCFLVILLLIGMIIYEKITKNYKYKIKKLVKIIIILVVVGTTGLITHSIIQPYGDNPKRLYIYEMKKCAKDNDIDITYDEKNNTLIFSDNTFTISNGSLDEYLNKYINGNEMVEQDIKNVRNLKDACMDLSKSILNAQSKFHNVNMDIIVKCIEKNSGKDMFIIKNDNLEYNILENVEKLKAEKEKDKKIEKAKNKPKESILENIPKKAPSLEEVKFGKLLDATENNNVLIVKVKIEPSYSNKATINQNGFNIEDLILNKNADLYDEIQYWAVADMKDGTESKVISFTIDKNLIKSIKNKNIVGNQIINQAKDVWILPTLLK